MKKMIKRSCLKAVLGRQAAALLLLLCFAVPVNAQQADLPIRLDGDLSAAGKLTANALPGDVHSGRYSLPLNDPQPVSVEFAIEDRSDSGSAALGERLQVTVAVTDDRGRAQQLYQGSYAGFVSRPAQTPVDADVRNLLYDVSFSLPGDAGNDLQNQSLRYTLAWTVSPAGIENPRTGDGTARRTAAGALALLLLSCLQIPALWRRRRAADRAKR